MARITGFAGWSFRARDPALLRQWYAQHLGLDPEHMPIGVQHADLSTFTPAEADAFDEHAAWSIRFWVDDLDAMVTQLRAAGIAVELGTESRGRTAGLRDPESNQVLLCERDRTESPVTVHVLDDHDPPASRGPWQRLTTWLPLLLIAALITVAVTVLDGSSSEDEPAAQPGDRTSARASPLTTTPVVPTRSVIVNDTDESILGVSAGWELFVRGGNDLVRIELAEGRVTRTALPTLTSGGPVSLVVGPERAMIRPFDHGDGYVVADGEPARTLPSALNRGGPVFRGPRPGTVWTMPNPSKAVLRRMDNGAAAGRSVSLPASSHPLGPDRRGNLVVSSTGGAYLTRPDGLDRITTGEVLAVGSTHFLVRECDERARCADVLVNRADGSRRVLIENAGNRYQPQGLIAPDGSVAALPQRRVAGEDGIRLVELASGATTTIDVSGSSGPRAYRHKMTWSPDGTWLFVNAGAGRVVAINANTHEVRTLGVELASVSQLAVRPAPR